MCPLGSERANRYHQKVLLLLTHHVRDSRHDDCNNTDDPFSQSDLTQTISDSQFNDDDMYRIIQSKFGQLDTYSR
jgi:hypothetical protein